MVAAAFGLTAFVADRTVGYDPDAGAFCVADRAAKPGCIPIGRVAGERRLLALAGGIDVAAAACDGTTDDRAAIEAAAAALSAKGGTIRLPPGRLCHVSTLTLPPNVTLDGGFRLPDNPGGSNAVIGYGSLGGLALSPSGTIALRSGSGLQNVLIKRAGMTFPAADTRAFAGTAVTFAGEDGPRVVDVTVLGFHTCIAETGTSVSRYRIEGLNCDGIDGEMITLPSWDSSVIRDVHNWPFSNAHLTTREALTRSGHGLHLAGAQDDTTVDNVLSIGYARGFWFGDTGSISIGKIWADYPAGHAAGSGSVGVWVDARTTGVLIDQLWAFSTERGVVANMTTGAKLKISALYVANTVGDGVSIAGGDVHASMAEFKWIGGHAYAVGSPFTHLYSRGTAERVAATTLVAAPAGVDPNNLDVAFTSDKGDGLAVFPDDLVPTPVASAPAINLPIDAGTVTVTGTATIDRLNGAWGGRTIHLRFSDAATVRQDDNIRLATPVFVGAAGRHLDLVFDAASGKWMETSRGPTPAVITDYSGTSTTAIPAGTTVHLGANGAQPVEAATRWTALRDYSAVTLKAFADAPPGPKRTFTYTLLLNGSPTAVSGTLSGSASSLDVTRALTIKAGDALSLRLVTGADATATNHRYGLALSR